MQAQIGLTVKIVDNLSTCFLGAISVEHVFPQGGHTFLRIETGEEGKRREVHNGRVYIMNAQGKTIEILDLGLRIPDPDPIAA